MDACEASNDTAHIINYYKTFGKGSCELGETETKLTTTVIANNFENKTNINLNWEF